MPRATNGPTSSRSSAGITGTLTALETTSPLSAAATCSATIRPARSCASCVEAPRCGVSTTLSSSKMRPDVYGSSGNTSSAAPATCPLCRPSTSASRSTSPPRAAFTIRTPGRILAIVSARTRCSVSGVSGACSVMKSDAASSSSSPACITWVSRKRSGDTNGSCAITCMPRPRARDATSWPIRPKPSTPSVLPHTSMPPNRLRSQRPSLSAACACGMLRAIASSRPTACSAADTMFEPGALATMMPRRVAAGTSTLSTPVPARPITFSLGACASSSSVTRVALRTIRAS